MIHGLLRRGETANLVSTAKVGKSWAAYAMGLCVATGDAWLGRFPCQSGKVLIIDNELKPCTLADRLPKVADAMGVPSRSYHDDIDVLSLRGRLMDLDRIAAVVRGLGSRGYSLVILDAWYRALPHGTSESENAQVTQLYNTIDSVCEHLGVAWVNVHHASKGNQSEKAVTDVGSGAGSQSRCVDCHIVLRQHEEPNAVVLDAAVRSFAPVKPLTLRWTFPVWTPDESLSPEKLKGRLTRQEEKTKRKDKAGRDAIISALVDDAKSGGAGLSARKLRDKTGLGRDTCGRILETLHDQIMAVPTVVRGNACEVYRPKNADVVGVVRTTSVPRDHVGAD